MKSTSFVPVDRLVAFNGSLPEGTALVVPASGGPVQLLADGHLIEISGPDAGSSSRWEAVDASGAGIDKLHVEVEFGSIEPGPAQRLDVEMRGGELLLVVADARRPRMASRSAVRLGRIGRPAAALAAVRFTRWRLVLDLGPDRVCVFERGAPTALGDRAD